ncbi:MAG: NAD(P)-dependent oxidoreductase, partial [Clostridiales bacterium]|nr:NAD(P)-dependent oxidoreductase [Clostridiales bacterium]
KSLFGSTVLVTGDTGLVGMSIVKTLIYLNENSSADIKILIAVRNLEKAKGIFGDDMESKGVTALIGDITDEISYEGTIDYIIHCASVTTSKYMVTNPVETIHISYEGTRQVMELARRCDVKSVVYVSSMEVYGSTKEEDNPITEEKLGYINVHNVRSSYSEGKRICELLCESYFSEFGVPVKMARLAQTFGAGVPSTDTRVFAQFARCLINGEDIVLHTKGGSVGNYCYTADVVEGILTLLTKGESGQSYNIVNENTSMMIREVASLVADDLGEGKISVVFDIPTDNKYGYPPETKMRLSGQKMRDLGWAPRYDLPEMFRRLIAYWEE